MNDDHATLEQNKRLLDPVAVTQLEDNVRWVADSKYERQIDGTWAPDILALIADWKRLREALERIRDSQESDLGEYAKFAQAEATAALEGGQVPGMSPEVAEALTRPGWEQT